MCELCRHLLRKVARDVDVSLRESRERCRHFAARKSRRVSTFASQSRISVFKMRNPSTFRFVGAIHESPAGDETSPLRTRNTRVVSFVGEHSICSLKTGGYTIRPYGVGMGFCANIYGFSVGDDVSASRIILIRTYL